MCSSGLLVLEPCRGQEADLPADHSCGHCPRNGSGAYVLAHRLSFGHGAHQTTIPSVVVHAKTKSYHIWHIMFHLYVGGGGTNTGTGSPALVVVDALILVLVLQLW